MSAGNVECLCVSLPHFYFKLLCPLSCHLLSSSTSLLLEVYEIAQQEVKKNACMCLTECEVFFKAMPHPSFKKQLTYGDQLTCDTLSNRFVLTQMSKRLTSKNISVSFELKQVLIPAVKLHFCYFRDVCSDLLAVLENLTKHQRLIVMDGQHILLSMCF